MAISYAVEQKSYCGLHMSITWNVIAMITSVLLSAYVRCLAETVYVLHEDRLDSQVKHS
jgi:hypothetical protein